MKENSVVSIFGGLFNVCFILSLKLVEIVSVWVGNWVFTIVSLFVWLFGGLVLFFLGMRLISRFFEEERQAELDEFSQQEGDSV